MSALVAAYFYLTSRSQRRAVRQYQSSLKQSFPDAPLPARFAVYRQFAAFGQAVADRFAVWQGKITADNLVLEDPDGLFTTVRWHEGRGQILICSHLGNMEICRALVSRHPGFKMNVLVYDAHSAEFSQALKAAGASYIQLIQVDKLDAAQMLSLSQKLDAGEWIAIAADRTPVRGNKTVAVDFLGRRAELPQGPWLLAGLLKARTNTIFRAARPRPALPSLSQALCRHSRLDTRQPRAADCRSRPALCPPARAIRPPRAAAMV